MYAMFQIPCEQRSLLNSLLRRKELSLREIAAMTYKEMGSAAGKKTYRAWESALYVYRAGGYHLQVVREDNLLKDPFVVSDIVIKALEFQISSDAPPNLNLLAALKSAKAVPQSLMSKLEGEVLEKLSADKESSNCLSRKPDRNYI